MIFTILDLITWVGVYNFQIALACDLRIDLISLLNLEKVKKDKKKTIRFLRIRGGNFPILIQFTFNPQI